MTDDPPPSDGDSNEDGPVAGRYVFGVRFHLAPTAPTVSVDPATFEATMYRTAPDPGTPDWRFFRDNLWHGEVNAPDHLRSLAEEALGVPVDKVDFGELQATPAYLDALRETAAANLADFRADTADEALRKYLGSSLRVVEDPDWAGD
ncbi:MAG: LWR-salt protein [Halobacteriales archaeon]